LLQTVDARNAEAIGQTSIDTGPSQTDLPDERLPASQ
jgi:hypothetical protein